MRTKFMAVALWMGLALGACSVEPAAEEDAVFTPVPEGEVALRLHGFHTSFEIAPVLLAADRHFPPGISIKQGGIPNLVGIPPSADYGDPGEADVATHAETQLLRYSVEHPDLRAIMTVTEGDYRIVANRAAGIETLADLEGKRIGTLADTSAVYFVQQMLATAGLTLDDVTLLGELPLEGLGEALGDGTIDALAIWEPEAEEGALLLGENAISFSGEGVYREIFNLNTTAANLADPAKRAAIKQFLGAIIDAAQDMRADPARAQALVGQMSGLSPDLIAAAWPHHRWVAGKAPDIVDALVAEEQWLAEQAGRPARPREELARLVDYSLLDEVLAERGQ